ncbi:g8434 [Coccomyxa elongata]
MSAVFVALENIYRAEMQMVSEEALRSLRIANDALEPLSLEPPKQSKRKSRRKMKRSDSSPPMPSAPLEPAEASQASYEDEDAPDSSRRYGSSDAISASQGMREAEERYAVIAEGPSSSSRAADGQPSSQNGSGPGQNRNGAPDESHKRAGMRVNGSSKHAQTEGSAKGPGSGGTSGGKVALQVLHDVVEAAVQPGRNTNGNGADGETNGAGHGRDLDPEPSTVPLRVAVNHERMANAAQERESAEPDVVPEVLSSDEGVQVESASRMEYDRSRWMRLPAEGTADPEKADAEFMRCILQLLRKAHFAQLTDRDEAMSRSLNSDYLDQLLIRADTSRLDARLVAHAAADRPVPEEEHALLVFKRGYGQGTRRGRMLVAKLDYLQLLVIKGSLAYLGKQTSRAWRAIKKSLDANTPEEVRSALDSREEDMEETAWERVQQAWGAVGKKLSDWGVVSPRLMLAGGGLFLTLSNWGLLPSVDVLPIERFNAVWRPKEPERLQPVYVERVTIREALRGDLLGNLFGPIQLVEPTFGELMVLYRRKPERNRIAELKAQILGGSNAPRLRRREPITLRVLRDIPVPSWKLVFPDKLLQFRPLDGLRADLLTVAGLAAFIAQAKYDSFILEVITTVSAVTLAVRVILGYNRMAQRYEKLENKVLAESTVAGQNASVQYLAACAALQQWEQSALAYLLLHTAPGPLSVERLSAAVESLLEDNFSVRVRFDAAEALTELERLQLLDRAEERAYDGDDGTDAAAFVAVAPDKALQQLRAHWDAFLDGCLRRRYEGGL